MADDLAENAREAVVSLASELFAGDEVGRVGDAAFRVVVRLLLTLYAESEGWNLLGQDTSLGARCERAETTTRARNRAGETDLWNRLNRSFERFANDAESRAITEFLQTHTVNDERLLEIVDSLATHESEIGGRERIDFSTLSVRHLGRLHERLLECDLAVADEPRVAVEVGNSPAESKSNAESIEPSLYLRTDTSARKSSGSYYTPESVVEYTIEQALEPLVEEVRDGLDPTDPEYATTVAERLFESSVLDPAMGSGHFLVAAAEYLAREVVRAQGRQVERIGAETLSARRDVRTARREVAESCLYGVDSDELAVELATVSLWISTHEPDEFPTGGATNSHLAHGNSLVGCRPNELPDDSDFGETVRRDRLDTVADVLIAEKFGDIELPDDAHECLLGAREDDEKWRAITREPWFQDAQSLADERLFFHWASSFPEIFGGGDRKPVGFDAVVGNPPYVRNRALDAKLKSYCRETYRTAEKAYDLYVPFVELACGLGRRVSLVVPNKWTTTEYGRTLRDQLLDRYSLREILDASAPSVFADANVYPVVVTVDCGDEAKRGEKEKRDHDHIRVRHADGCRELADAPVTTVPRSLLDRVGGRVVPLDLDAEFADIAASVLDRCPRLGDHVAIAEGIHTGNARETLVTDENVRDDCHRLVDGTCVDRYRLDWDGQWVRYDDALLDSEAGEYADFRSPEQFDGEKLFVRDISRRPVAVYDSKDFYALNTLYTVREREESAVPLRYLLGVFNSGFVARYFRQVYGGTHVSGDYLRYKPTFTEEIPVPDPDSEKVSPREIAATVGLELDLPAAPAQAVSDLTERLRGLYEERSSLDTDVLGYFPEPIDGPDVEAWSVPAAFVTDSILAETACEREGLRVGTVGVRREEGTPILSVTARYKPECDGANEKRSTSDRDGASGHKRANSRRQPTRTLPTDRWGFTETEPIPALRFPDCEERAGALLEAFVPAAVERADGFAEFRENATKTYSLLDRLESLRLPNASASAEAFARYREVRERAESLDDRIRNSERALDHIVYRLYGLRADEIELVEQLPAE